MSRHRVRPRRLYSVAVLGAVAVTTFAWATKENRRLPGPGVRAPAFTAMTLDGGVASLEDYAGQVILLNVWATWCPPCREEMPSMERLYTHFKERGEDFTILAVSIDAALGEPDAAGNVGGDLKAFAREYGLTFPILHDPEGTIQQTYFTTGVPESFIIGRDGIIQYRIAGATDWDTPIRRQAIERMLARGSSDDGSHKQTDAITLGG